MVTHPAERGHDTAHESPDDHTVVVFGIPDDTEALERLLRQFPDMDVVTVKQIIMSLPGLVPVSLTRTEAADTAAQIRQLGVNATSIPEADIPDISHALNVHHLRVDESSLEVIDYRDESHQWPCSDIQVLSVGVVPSTAPPHHRPAPNLSMASSHQIWNEGSHIPARNRPEAFIILRDGAVLHIASDEMNYEYLGSRINTSSIANFTMMVRDLRHFGTGAWMPPSTRAFLDHAPVRHSEFRTREDFKQYTQFQTLLSAQFTTRG